MKFRLWKAQILGLSLLLILALDQWSKLLAVEHLRGRASLSFFGGLARLLYVENQGAWGGLGGHWPEPLRVAFLIAFPTIILVVLMGHIVLSRSVEKGEAIGLSLIVAGGWGNMLDRLRLGFVVDMFWVGFPGSFWQTNVFNVADAVIMTGLGLLVVVHLRDFLKKKSRANPQVDI